MEMNESSVHVHITGSMKCDDGKLHDLCIDKEGEFVFAVVSKQGKYGVINMTGIAFGSTRTEVIKGAFLYLFGQFGKEEVLRQLDNALKEFGKEVKKDDRVGES